MKQDSRLHTLDRTLDRVLAYRPSRRAALAQAIAGAANPLHFYEFFAGGGMARIGLGPGWSCGFANDIDESKASAYKRNFQDSDELVVDDIANVAVADLPGRAHLAWASFPCQDLSLAGNGAGLKGERSGMFWEFWRLVQGLRAVHRAPRIIVLENGKVVMDGPRDAILRQHGMAPQQAPQRTVKLKTEGVA